MTRMSRRQMLKWAAACPTAAGFAAITSPAQDSTPPSAQIASLQDQLEKGLRARRKVEFQFLARVVTLVDQQKITRVMVQGTFSFVMRKYQDRKYLVPIFEQALRKRLADAGNPALDNVPTTLR